MPIVKFGKKEEPETSFKMSDDLVAVRTHSTRSLASKPVLSPAANEIMDSKLVLSFPEEGVEVYRVPKVTEKPLVRRLQIIRTDPDVKFAGGVLIDEQSGEPVIYTENIFIKFFDEIAPELCRRIIEEAALQIKKEISYAVNTYFTAARTGIGVKVFDIALQLLEKKEVEYCHPEIIRKRSPRQLFSQQWHLEKTVINGIEIDASVNIREVHQNGITGEGIIIAVIDDGVDIDHPEFNTPGHVVHPIDIKTMEPDPRPRRGGDNHGTACAGVACAKGVNGASGVAPGAKLMPIRIDAMLGSQREGDAFAWAAEQGADIISCSWGADDGDWFNPEDPRHQTKVPIPASTRVAIDYAATKGRNGKGCIIFFAAGNGNEPVENDGYASYQQVTAVAACNDRGARSVYSDYGKAIWCAFPSNDFEFGDFGHPAPLTTGIWTTDRVGKPGYNPGNVKVGDKDGNYTNSFGGTSSATPGVAGVAALLLSVDPNLTVTEVRDIIRTSCQKIDGVKYPYDNNGFNDYCGYGRVHAPSAVSLLQQRISDKKIQLLRSRANPKRLI